MPKRQLILSILSISAILVGGSANSCIQQVKLNENATISCPFEGKADRYYWYFGSTSETEPILALDNGEKSGTKYKDGHYDITSEGQMEITNVQMEHEGIYTFVVIFPNITSLQRDILVSIKRVRLVIPCRLKHSLELGQNVTVGCKVDGQVYQYGWYLDTISNKKPILTLHNGVKGGSMYQDHHYDITDEGEMKIIDAQKNHSGNYVFVVVFHNGTEGEQSIRVDVVKGFAEKIPRLWVIACSVVVVFVFANIVIAVLVGCICSRYNRKGNVNVYKQHRRHRSRDDYYQLSKLMKEARNQLIGDSS